MARLFIIYQAGRFGPEKILGYIVAHNAECILETTYLTYDIIGKVNSMGTLAQQIKEYETAPWAVHITNPKSIGSLQDYRKWQRRIRKVE